MNRKGLYGNKNYADVCIKTKEDERTLDWLNDVHILKSGEADSIVIETQLSGGSVESLFERLRTEECNVEVSFVAKTYETGEDIEVKRNFKNMRFVREVSSYSYESFGNFIWVFSNDYYSMREEIEGCINRIIENREKSRKVNNLEKIKEDIHEIGYSIKDIADHYHFAGKLKEEVIDELVKVLNTRK